MRRVHTRSDTTRMISMSVLLPVIDDADDGQVARKVLRARRLARRRAADADHPVARDAAHRVHRHAARAAGFFPYHQEWTVPHFAYAVGRNQCLFNLHDLHESPQCPCELVSISETSSCVLPGCLPCTVMPQNSRPSLARIG